MNVVKAGWKPVWFKPDKDHNGETYWVVDRWYWDECKKVLDAGKNPVDELKAEQYAFYLKHCAHKLESRELL